MHQTSSPVLQLDNVIKDYSGETSFRALHGVDLQVFPGEVISIIGPSGSGKSTMLHLLGCLDKPTQGEIIIDGSPITKLNPNGLAEVRRKKIGFIFQAFNLAPTMTVFQNVELPLMIAGMPEVQRKAIVERNLSAVGLFDKSQNMPNQLSGGQKQRAAIARALVNEPKILLADEPTGNLDTKSGHDIMQFIMALGRKRGITMIFVTHDPDIADYTDRIVRIVDGRIESDVAKKAKKRVGTHGN